MTYQQNTNPTNTIIYNSLYPGTANVVNTIYNSALNTTITDPQPLTSSAVLFFQGFFYFIAAVHFIILLLYLIEWLGDIGRQTIDELDIP